MNCYDYVKSEDPNYFNPEDPDKCYCLIYKTCEHPDCWKDKYYTMYRDGIGTCEGYHFGELEVERTKEEEER